MAPGGIWYRIPGEPADDEVGDDGDSEDADSDDGDDQRADDAGRSAHGRRPLAVAAGRTAAGTWRAGGAMASRRPGAAGGSAHLGLRPTCARFWQRKHFSEVVGILGDRWVDVPCLELFPPPSSAVGSGEPPTRPAVPFASQWSGGPGGNLPTFKVERICAPLVQDVLLGNNMRPTTGADWLVLWSGPRLKDGTYEGMHEYQKVNHFPGSTELTRKDRLWTHFHEMSIACGEDSFDFVPQSFVLPDEAEEFKGCYGQSGSTWIVKPQASSQGRGIFLLRDLSELPSSKVVVCKYVDNPLLIQGLKFDMRIYVLVTSFDPLRAYVYREGLTRFASKPYSNAKEHLGDVYRHLTNYSINKKAKNFIENQTLQEDNVGHKWSLSALNRHLRHVGVDVDLMWQRIMDLIVKTLLSVEPHIARKTRESTVNGNCFELYGFDVLVDESLKPWLLEVNLSPSMQADSPLDVQVKSSLLSDAFTLVGFRNVDRQTATTSRLRSRLQQLKRMSGEEPPEGTEAEASSVDDMDETSLKMVAQALDELERQRNFIRLYPTRASIAQYATITQARRDPGEAARARLLARMMYGPLLDQPVSPSMALAARPAPVPGGAVAAEDHGGAGGGAEPERRAAPSAVDLDSIQDSHDPDRVSAAMGVVGVLGTRSSTRLALMEYLIRICSECSRLGPAERQELEQSGAAGVLRAFRQQLALFLRRSATAMKAPRASELPPLLPNHGAGAGGDFVERLAGSARLVVEALGAEVWGSDRSAPSERAPALPPASEISTLAQCAPQSFMRSVSGQRAMVSLSGLSAMDLEGVLRSRLFVTEVGMMLDDVEDLDALATVVGGAAAMRRRLRNAGVLTGPLSELQGVARSAAPLPQQRVEQGPALSRTQLPPPAQPPAAATCGPRARSAALASAGARSVGVGGLPRRATMARSAPVLPPLEAAARRAASGSRVGSEAVIEFSASAVMDPAASVVPPCAIKRPACQPSGARLKSMQHALDAKYLPYRSSGLAR